MASRTVTVRSGAPGMLVSTAQYATPPGRLTVSCGLLQQQVQHSTVLLVDVGLMPGRNTCMLHSRSRP
jgi:hypothetical protein